MSKNKASQPPRLSIKFLVSNTIAGSIIGTGGSTIKELMEVTDARVTVSGVNDVYPGTSERIILLTGSFDSLNIAQSLLWDMFAVNAKVMNKKTVLWSPREASENSSDHDSIFVSGKITVAASAGGLLLGRGGSTLRTISEESDAKVQMSSKEQSMFTQERVIAISGNKGCCVNCVKLILNKLSEDLESAQYANKGLTYSAKIPTMLAMGASYHESISRNHNGYNNHHHMSSHDDHNDNISSTKITLNVPDNLIGNILGRHGVTMREIMSLSGAKIAVSNRPDDVANTKPGDILTRTVTITGSPTQAQTAHLFITQRLQSPTPAPTRKSRSNTGPKRSNKNESGPVGTNDEEEDNSNSNHNNHHNNDNNESEEDDDDVDEDVDEEEEDNNSDHK